MDSKLKQGTLDLVLLAVLDKETLYGLEIIKEVNRRTVGAFDFKEGSLYPALHRLVKAGWVTSYWENSTSGGAPRKYYRLTDDGRRALQKKRHEWNALKDSIEALLHAKAGRISR